MFLIGELWAYIRLLAFNANPGRTIFDQYRGLQLWVMLCYKERASSCIYVI